MSVHVISWVLRNSPARLGSRCVLIVLADHAQGDGTGAWPSVETIAKEARLSETQTHACLKQLLEAGMIEKTGVSASGTNVYTVIMEGGAESEPPKTAPEPSLDHSVPSEPREAARVRPLVAFYFDHAAKTGKYVPRGNGVVLARSIRLAKEAGVTDYDIQGGIKLMLAKGFGPETLGRFITEYQAIRTPPPKEGGPLWDETYEPQTPEQNERDALKALNELFGPASTADSPPPDSPAKGTTTSPS